MVKKIPYFDLTKQNKKVSQKALAKIKQLSDKNAFSGGEYVSNFEKKFARFLGAKHAVGVNCGTSALHLALRAANIGFGDEVIVPALTFIATADAATYVGATPVFVDCRADTWQIDAKEVEKKITPKTKAIIGVHLSGQPFDVDAIDGLAKKYKLILVEDCAQAHGAIYKGKMVGTIGDFGCFSFYPSKNLGAWGQAGAVVTKNKTNEQLLKKLRDHGQKKKYSHDMLGYNYVMDGIQAAVLSIKLDYLNQWNRQRKHIAQRYSTEIKNDKIMLQHQSDQSSSVFYLFTVLVRNKKQFVTYLAKHNISTGQHYKLPLPFQRSYQHLNYKIGDFPNAEYYVRHAVSLPMYPELTKSEVTKIIGILNNY